MKLVDLVSTKKALRIFHDDDDEILCEYIETASAMVVDYLDTRAEDHINLDSSGELVPGSEVRSEIKTATRIIVESLYIGDDSEKSRPGGIPYRAETILYRLTTPPIA